jgi:hypothetical protein
MKKVAGPGRIEPQTKQTNSMQTNTIKFHEDTDDMTSSDSTWSTSKTSTYQDLLLKPEYKPLRFKFPIGATWFRILPALKAGSSKCPILKVQTLNYKAGRHVHKRTVIPGAKSVFDTAYEWMQANRPEMLFSKHNKKGVRLLTDPLNLMWIITEIDGKSVARLLLTSGYDGSRGGSPGLGHQISYLAQERDEDGNLLGNPAHSMHGTQLCIDKKQVTDARYPSYNLKRGRIPVPAKELLSKLDADDSAALVPLEQVLHVPSEEEEWQLLEHVIDPETVRQIRESSHKSTDPE